MSTRAAAEGLVWVLGAALSIGAAWATWSAAPAILDTPAAPPPLPRPATPAEEAAVQQLSARVMDELRASQERVGRSPALGELEGTAPDGRPYLASGLPDNPLAPGVAGVVDGCAGAQLPASGVDWWYCPAPLMFAPAHAGGAAQSGNP